MTGYDWAAFWAIWLSAALAQLVILWAAYSLAWWAGVRAGRRRESALILAATALAGEQRQWDYIYKTWFGPVADSPYPPFWRCDLAYKRERAFWGASTALDRVKARR